MGDGGELGVTACKDNVSDVLSISITDTGCGISKENLDKILEPFFTTKKNGTGLGLGLAYQTIRSHRGSVKINSKPGEGTSVDIKIPINNSR
jgi:signal transduction histidine kinase